RFVYGQLDWFIKRKADSYFDFNEAQEKAFEKGLAQVLRINRRERLPQYAAHLRESARVFSEKKLDRKKYDERAKNFERLIKETASDFIPLLSRTMVSLSPAQIENFREEWKDHSEELKEKTEGDAEQRAEK